MRSFTGWKARGAAAAAAGALVVTVAGYGAPGGAALAAPAARPATQQTGPVSPVAALGTPQLNKTEKGQLDVVRQLAQCGPDMYAVGRFGSINQGSTDYTVNNIFRFEASSPYTVDDTWLPDVNGEINSIALNASCTDAYIGGSFTEVNGTSVHNIAEIDTSTGDLVTGFGTDANNQVETVALAGSGTHLLVGGYFTEINGSKNKYMVSLSPTTGDDDGFLELDLSGTYDYCQTKVKPYDCTSSENHTMVYNQQISPSGAYDLVEGRFTSVAGQQREQIFMLDLASDPATVTAWTSPQFDGSDPSEPYQCQPPEAFYIRSAAWSPDSSTVYTAATGFHPNNVSTSGPRTGLCDSVAAWPATTTGSVPSEWIEYTGCDSYYTVAADEYAVYAAGHERWADNPDGCNAAGSGAITDAGMVGLYAPGSTTGTPGTAYTNSSGTGLYTMTRANADDMLVTSEGLWIASTNRYTVNKCGDLTGPPGDNAADHAGICLLPYNEGS